MGNRAGELAEVIQNVRRVLQAISKYSREAEQSTGLTGPQLWALQILDVVAPIGIYDLANRMYLSPSTVVGIIDRLEAKDLVTRKRSEKDRRAVELKLTEFGERLMKESPEIAQAMLLKGLGQLNYNQFAVVSEGMQLLVKILGAENIKPQPMFGP